MPANSPNVGGIGICALSAHAIRPLALRPKQCAAALGISPRHLANLTKAGMIPCVRLGNVVVYPVVVIEAFLAEGVKRQKDGGA